MASKKLTISSGLSQMAIGTTIATGMIAGVEFEVPHDGASQNHHGPEVVWDDSEEQNYRAWVKEVQESRSSKSDLEWSELDNEQAYRERLRESTASKNVNVTWDDDVEKEYRRIYLEMRKEQLAQANWQEFQAEENHRTQMKKQQESRSRKPVRWDDEDERRCQEKYRQKYNKN